MATKDLAQAVNQFMLSNAPTLASASPLAYDLLKQLARQLLFNVKTTKEHSLYVMGKKYGHLYAQSCLSIIIDEAYAEDIEERIGLAKKRRANKRLQFATAMQPSLCF